MRQLGCALVLLALAVTAASGGPILYATAGSEQRIDGFCLDPNGALAGSPNGKSFPTAAGEPRRLLVAEGVVSDPDAASRDVLYVALLDRVQAFRILSHGGLDPLGSTNALVGMDPRDLLLSRGKNRLYVAQRGYNRIAAYDIRSDGGLAEDWSSCVLGFGSSRYVILAGPSVPASSVSGAFLYASSEQDGRIDIYPLDATGNLLEVVVDDEGEPVIDPATNRPTISNTISTNCRNVDDVRPPATDSLSNRRGLQQPKAMILDGEMLYVEERARHAITAFRLDDGLFCATAEQCPGFDTLATPKCLARQQQRIASDKEPRQCPAGRASSSVQYENVVLFGNTLLGTSYFQGRIEGYRLRTSGDGLHLLPKSGPQYVSKQDLAMTPVRSVVTTLKALRGECSETDPSRPCSCDAANPCAGVLYVGAGTLDRVIAYSIDKGAFPRSKPFSRTEKQKGSFPNDVAVAVLPDACR